MVLVHGAWQGSWAFAAWLPHLQRRGWQVHAVDLPGNGWPPKGDARADLAAYTDHVAQVLHRIDEPVVLVGHSGGGITASQVAEVMPAQVAGLVYLAGMMLPTGLSFAELVRRCTEEQPETDFAGISPHLEWNADHTATGVREAGALSCFLQDCSPDVAKQAAAMLRPQPESGRAMTNTLSVGRFSRVPRVYVECSADRSILPTLQRKMQELSPGAQCLVLDCGHVPQLAQPLQLTDLLCPVLDALSSPTHLF